ncbi:hypothetical protein BO71DRAFT_340171, partial [Aspergillus ellipticus CBS 707.79]
IFRSEIHDTTSINGVHQKDPLGPHVTLCYKDEDQFLRGTHGEATKAPVWARREERD